MIVIIILVLIIFVISCLNNTVEGGGISKIGTVKNIKLLDRKVKNLVSVSWYTLPNAYRPLSEYTKGLMTVMKIIEANKFDHDIILRVYYDFTIDTELEEYKILMKSDYVELIYVDCRKLIKKENYNSLTMLMRYLPYFSNDCNYNSVSDIDFNEKRDINIKYKIIDEYIKVIDKNYDFLFMSPVGYRPFWTKLKKLDYMCLGHSNYGRVKLDLSIFTNFINDFVNSSKFDDYKQVYIEQQSKLIKHSTDNKFELFKASKKLSQMCSKKHCYFTYGFDEMFLNNIIVPMIINQYDNVYRKIIKPQGGEYYLFSNLIIDKHDLGEFDYDYLIKSFGAHKYEPDEKLSELYVKFRKFVLDNPDKFNKFYYDMIEEMPFYLNDTNNIIKIDKSGGMPILKNNDFTKITGVVDLLKERPIDTLYNLTIPNKIKGFNVRILKKRN